MRTSSPCSHLACLNSHPSERVDELRYLCGQCGRPQFPWREEAGFAWQTELVRTALCQVFLSYESEAWTARPSAPLPSASLGTWHRKISCCHVCDCTERQP